MKDVLLSSIALEQFKDLDETLKKRIRKALELYRTDGRGDVKKLKGTQGRESLYRLRVGDYRIIFAQRDDSILITQIVPISQGYDWL